jgi:hypothetical protein
LEWISHFIRPNLEVASAIAANAHSQGRDLDEVLRDLSLDTLVERELVLSVIGPDSRREIVTGTQGLSHLGVLDFDDLPEDVKVQLIGEAEKELKLQREFGQDTIVPPLAAAQTRLGHT